MNRNKVCITGLLFLLLCLSAAHLGAQNLAGLNDTGSEKVTVAASTRYEKPGFPALIFLGQNYRSAWGRPVQMPVFDIAKSGFQIIELGGGQQTKSLRLKDATGTEWVLRTVDKDVDGAMPPKLKGTIAQKAVQGLISAAHPYAPLIVAELAKAVGVSAPDPLLYFVPDDPAFGPYRDIFAGQVCYLEWRHPTPDGATSKSTADVQQMLLQQSGGRIWQEQVLQARLLDMLVADWDRHEDQWRWGTKASAGQKFYYAIPRDRDQAFFKAGGLLPRVGKAVAVHHLNWFKKKPRGLRKLNFKSSGFDRLFLNGLSGAEWESGIRNFQNALSDAVIQKAVARMPPEVQKSDSNFFMQRLKSRRDGLLRPVMRYYRTLAREVIVWGTAGPDLFEVQGSGDGLLVQVFKLEENGRKGAERYRRIFTKSETRRLHVRGLGGDDHFVVKALPQRMPNVHLYGGAGNDIFELPQKEKRIHLHQ